MKHIFTDKSARIDYLVANQSTIIKVHDGKQNVPLNRWRLESPVGCHCLIPAVISKLSLLMMNLMAWKANAFTYSAALFPFPRAVLNL